MLDKNFYQILGVDQKADEQEIVDAYNELRKRLSQKLAESKDCFQTSQNIDRLILTLNQLTTYKNPFKNATRKKSLFVLHRQ